MSKDLEEFLKMAAARRQQAKGNAQPAQPPQAQRPSQQRPAQQRPIARTPIVEAEIIEDVEIIEPLTSSIHSNINTRDIQEHVSHLGEGVIHASEEAEADVYKKFDHDVGRLYHDHDLSLTSPEQGHTETAASLARLFADPEGIRNAIIMREILDRPNFD